MQVAQPAVIFTSPDGLPVALRSAEANGIRQENVILLEGEHDGITSLADLISSGKRLGQGDQVPTYQLPPGKTNGDICAFLGFSSGTTGLPKGVRSSQCNLPKTSPADLDLGDAVP